MTWQVSPRNKVAGFYEHQYRVWEQLVPTIAYESATKYDFPRNEFLTGSYSSPITSKLLFDARVSDIIQGWKDRYPNGGTSLAFTEPLPDAFKSLIAVTEQGGLIPGLLYRGAGQTGLGPFIRVQGHIASAQASLSYVTGAHALKVGFLDTFGTRRVDYENIDSNVRYRFNNGVPNLITEVATPYGFTNNLGSELGVFAQDKWTLRRLTLNLGAALRLLEYQLPGTAARARRARAQSEHHVSGTSTTWAGTIFPRGSGPSTTCSATARRRSRSTWAATCWRNG